MKKRTLGRTGLQVTELALGTWGLSGDGYGAVRTEDAEAVVTRALEAGIELFDTSDAYGKGEMEKLLGRLVPKDKGALIITKIGTDRDSTPPKKRFDTTFVRESFERCQERLQRDELDVVLLHNPSKKAMEAGEALELLIELKKRKLVKAVGVSAGSVEVARLAIQHGADVLELAYNVFQQKDLHELSGEIEISDLGILARSVLAHGLLAGHWSADVEFHAPDHRAERWSPQDLKTRIGQLDALRPLVGGAVASLRSAALRFVLSNMIVSSAVLGPRSVAQLDQLVKEGGFGPPYLKDTALAELSVRLKHAGIEA